MKEITKAQFAAMLSTAAARQNIDAWIQPLNSAMEESAINSPARQAAFLAQILHESGEFQHLVENLRYSAERLRQVWPSRFTSNEIAAAYGYNPEKIANKVYASRMGNGDESSGDGWKFRGRGLIQLTGRQNYTKCGKALGLDTVGNPDLLAQPAGAARSAAWYWGSLNLNALADDKPGVDANDEFIKITRLINGGTVGLLSRLTYWKTCKEALAGG